ncbi:MAG: LPP20 family lipoprotein [Desulfobacteraceae bacterium]
MKKNGIIWLILVFLSAVTLNGCSLLGVPADSSKAVPGSAVAPQNSGTEERIVTFKVTGKGMVPEIATSPAQGRLLAERAAISDGYRQLVEKIKGVYVEAYSKTSEGQIDYDVIRTKTQSWLRGVNIIDTEEVGQGIFQVHMSLRIYFTQKDLIWWPQGLGSNILPMSTRPVKYYLAKSLGYGDSRSCVSYPWCGRTFYYRPHAGR